MSASVTDVPRLLPLLLQQLNCPYIGRKEM